MRVWLVAIVLAVMALAGCIGDDAETQEGEENSPDENTPNGGEDSGADDGDDGGDDGVIPDLSGNSPPQITSFVASSTEGDAPFTVSFSWNGTDEDGDELTWTFDADGDSVAEEEATVLPWTFNFTFDEAGTYQAHLELSDGQETVTDNLTITVADPDQEADPDGEDEPEPEEPAGPIQHETLAWNIGPSDLGTINELLNCEAGPLDGVTHRVFEVLPEATGKTFDASITDAAGGEDIIDWAMLFSDPGCGVEDYVIYSVEGSGPMQEKIPKGYTFAYAFSTGGAMLEVDFVVL